VDKSGGSFLDCCVYAMAWLKEGREFIHAAQPFAIALRPFGRSSPPKHPLEVRSTQWRTALAPFVTQKAKSWAFASLRPDVSHSHSTAWPEANVVFLTEMKKLA
jgi:hypothetical protein